MAKSQTSPKMETPSVLAFERKLDPSDALLFSGSWDKCSSSDAGSWQPVVVRPKSVRGTISNRLKAKDQDSLKLDAAIENPNLQNVDVATLPANTDTLKIQFTLRILSGVGTPSACNDREYKKKLEGLAKAYAEGGEFAELGSRYAANLANGRFLWRNRIGAEEINIKVSRMQSGIATQSWDFNALSYSLSELEETAKAEAVKGLGELIAKGLAGKEKHVLLQVTAFVRVGAGQEVFPSQELILDRGRGDKSKTLYHVNGTAAIHSQKIGNALRTIDTWYTGAAENGPIAIEPYGSVTSEGKAWRQPKQKKDFYNLFDGWLTKDQGRSPDEQHYIMAILVRGGVFGEAKKKDKKDDSKDGGNADSTDTQQTMKLVEPNSES